jgi:hypothetical protein
VHHAWRRVLSGPCGPALRPDYAEHVITPSIKHIAEPRDVFLLLRFVALQRPAIHIPRYQLLFAGMRGGSCSDTLDYLIMTVPAAARNEGRA